MRNEEEIVMKTELVENMIKEYCSHKNYFNEMGTDIKKNRFKQKFGVIDNPFKECFEIINFYADMVLAKFYYGSTNQYSKDEAKKLAEKECEVLEKNKGE